MGMLLNRLVKRDSTQPALAATMPLFCSVTYQALISQSTPRLLSHEQVFA